MLLFKLIKEWKYNRKLTKIINEVYEQDQIIAKISQIFGVQFYKDWIGRLYGVVNPYIRDGKWDQSQVFEYTEQGIDTTEHAHQWMMQRMSILQGFIRANNLFDLLTYDIKKLDGDGNYLLVIQPISQIPFFQVLKRFLIRCAWLLPIIGCVVLVLWKCLGAQ